MHSSRSGRRHHKLVRVLTKILGGHRIGTRGQGTFSGYLSELLHSERYIQYLFNFKNLLKGKKFIEVEVTDDT